MSRRRKPLALLIAGLLGGAIWIWQSGTDDAPPEIRTAAVTVGDVRQTVRATGTLEAVTTVAVGTQVSGVVSWLGADFNSMVRKGQVIARLEPSLLQAQVEQARANLTRINTEVRQRQLAVDDRDAKHARARQLAERQLISASDLEEAKLDAFPGRRFAGTVAQVRLQPTVISNVTTYATIIEVANDQMELKPGMTASAEIEIERRTNVLRVPNTALRFRPTPDIFAALRQEPAAERPEQAQSTTARVIRVSAPPAESDQGTQGRVWVDEEGELRPIELRLGLADGTHTELLDGDVPAGTELVTNVLLPGASVSEPAPNRNLFGGGRRRF